MSSIHSQIKRGRISRRSSMQPILGSKTSCTKQTKRSPDLIKALLFIGLSQKYHQQHNIIKISQQQAMQRKLAQQNNNSCIVQTIQPVRKSMKQLNRIGFFLSAIEKQCAHYILDSHKSIEMASDKRSSKIIESNIFVEDNTKPQEINLEVQSPMKVSGFNNKHSQHKNIRVRCHQRFHSDTLAVAFHNNPSKPLQTCNSSYLKKTITTTNNFHKSSKKDKQNYLKTISNNCNMIEYSTNSLRSLFEVFLQSIHKANYMINIFISDSLLALKTSEESLLGSQMNQSRITNEKHFRFQIKELTDKFNKIIKICEELQSTSFDKNISKTNESGIQCENNKFKPYIILSNRIVAYLRSLYNSIYFPQIILSKKDQIKRLVILIYDTRYTLKYLQKEIQNRSYQKKPLNFSSKWQKAYHTKFMPKRHFI